MSSQSGQDRDEQGLEILDQDECLELLASTPVGRIAWISDGRPLILPVNHVIEDGDVLFVTTPGSKLDGALRAPSAPVAYEADGYDADEHTGWSVLVEGRIEAVMDEVEQARLDREGAPAWIDVFRDRRWVRIRSESISGRRLPADLET